MSKAIDRKFEKFVSEIMTAYRWIPLLFSLITRGENEIGDVAWGELTEEIYRRIPKESHQELDGMLYNFLEEQVDWINYSMADLRFYLSNLPHVDDSLKFYSKMMDDKAKFFNWKKPAFRFNSPEKLLLLDIGCGQMSFVKLFAEANPETLRRYIGIDKRNIGEHFKKLGIPIQNISFIHKDFSKVLSNEEELNLLSEPDVLFFGQLLHCMPHPIEYVQSTMRLFDTVKQIKILEPRSSRWGKLSTAFGFHMAVHSNGTRVEYDVVSTISCITKWSLREEEASSQHIMYTLTKPPPTKREFIESVKEKQNDARKNASKKTH